MVREEDVEKIKNRDEQTELARWIGRISGRRFGLYDFAWEKKYYLRFGVPITAAELEAAWFAGMLRKEELKDGAYYWGCCRNARVAMWDADKGSFVHMRLKGDWHPEKIPYPSDEKVVEFAPGRLTACDVFIPWLPTEPLDFERVVGKEIN